MTTILDTIGRTVFQLGYQLSPIILSGGLASLIPGQMLPIIAITEAPNFLLGLLNGGGELDPDNFFAHYRPAPGGTLVDNQIGEYTFANQTVAANAIIAQPLRISLEMVCPVREAGGYTSKLLTFLALKAALDSHNSQGGTYIIATPAFIYFDCVMTALRDVTPGESRQAQTHWMFDFTKPLLTLADAQTAQNTQMSKIENGLQTDGSSSGPNATIGSTLSGAASAVISSARGLVGAVTSGIDSLLQ